MGVTVLGRVLGSVTTLANEFSSETRIVRALNRTSAVPRPRAETASLGVSHWWLVALLLHFSLAVSLEYLSTFSVVYAMPPRFVERT